MRVEAVHGINANNSDQNIEDLEEMKEENQKAKPKAFGSKSNQNFATFINTATINNGNAESSNFTQNNLFAGVQSNNGDPNQRH
jgi:hypothetical protein